MLMSALFLPGTFKRQGWGLSNGRGGEDAPEYATIARKQKQLPKQSLIIWKKNGAKNTP